MKVIIVGGGIGGLAAAAAFHQRGMQVEVLERAAAFTEVGAGLTVQPNGLRALDVLGLGDPLRAHGLADPLVGVRNSRGGWLIRNDVATLRRTFGASVLIPRTTLIDLLKAAVPAESLRPATEVHSVRPDGTVHHSGGVSEADLVVGADGVNSVTRRSLWPHLPGPSYVGYTTWRFMAPPHPVEGSVETWGSGERFGQVPMADGRVYCYVIANAPAGTHIGLDELRRRFTGWHRPIPALLESVSGQAALQHDTYELPALPTYVSDNAAVLGDAAHAMTPNLGQGACQALEDAVTLAHTVNRLGLRAGLQEYDRLRRPRTQQIVRLSRQVGAPGHWTSAPLVALRNTVFPRLPKSLLTRSLGPTLTWTI
ncbi:FAD-dependent monooxygenase [Nonomuraea longicatena]|uniref:FAD-dependent monooxygenase n=1 Tax=Nonomuraea longicatena TaxID=83682 RepID=A0ABN1QID3_9ACTN